MNLLIDPNVAYFLLMAGLVLGVLAVFTPGTGLIELGALFAVILSIYGLSQLPIRSWAISLLIIGFIPFFFVSKKTWRKGLIPLSVLLTLIGSLFIFRPQAGLVPANQGLMAFIALTATMLLWLFAIKGSEVFFRPASMNPDDWIGQEGIALTEVQNEGTVYFHGENWSARSKTRIPPGTRIKVIERNGLMLLVEPVKDPFMVEKIDS